jgi:alcohol dehydrogenase (cytochrome c)
MSRLGARLNVEGRCPLTPAAAISVALALLGGTAQAQAPFEPVTDAELRSPSDSDWLQWRRTYDGWGYSPLDQIDRENVGSLTLAWSRALSEGSVQLIPLVHDGVMYIPHPGGVIEAVDATNGDRIWRYDRVPPDGAGGSATTRNIAIYGDRIYYAAPTDGSVVALDARTGEVVWETVVHDNREDRAFHSSGPIVVRGKVLTGRSCQPGGLAGGCFIAAHDAETGQELWRAFTIARPGEPGGDTWGGLPLEDRYHVSTWMPGTYDPELDLVYWGTGVPGPYAAISRGAEYGDLLYSNSTLALDPDTGEIVWYYQHLPGDEMDADHVYERILVDVVVEPGPEVTWPNPAAVGEARKVLWTAGKAGTQFVLDRESGEFLWASPMLHQNHIAAVDPGGRVIRNRELTHRELGDTLVGGPRAGKDWWYGAYSPLTNAVYQPLLNAWLQQESMEWGGAGQASYRETIPSPDQPGLPGMVKAYDIATGRLLWEHKQPAPWLGGLVTTGGGLVFGGDLNRRFRALDQETGRVLWETILNSRVTGGAISYAVDGRQYIAVAAGGGTFGSYETLDLTPDLGLEAPTGSNTIFVFALPERR